MDTITQIALGAAVGEAVLGRKVGNKALLWGAVAGTIPDLDVLASPFFNEMEMLGIHRGFSHSVFFAMIFAPVFGWLTYRYYEKKIQNASWREWGWLFFWGIFTHPLLDAFTCYGTQFFQPISDYPVALSSVFIIDPVYSLPLIIGLLFILRLGRKSEKRRIINYAILAFSTAYLLVSFAIQLYVENTFKTQLTAQGIAYKATFATPLPLNIFLWMGLAQSEDTVVAGVYSIFDGDAPIQFQHVPRNSELLAGKMDQRAIRQLFWFSRGFYHVKEKAGTLYFHDMRFGRNDFWFKETGDYIFTFRLIPSPNNAAEIVNFKHERPPFLGSDNTLLKRFWERIWGVKD